jgi:hypothetical protein
MWNYKKALLIVIVILLAPQVLADWQDSDNCQVFTACNIQRLLTNNSFSPISGASCNITIRNETAILLANQTMSSIGGGYYNYSFTPNNTGIYPSSMLCAFGTELAIQDVSFVAQNFTEGNGMIAFIIILPLLFGLLLILGAAYLSDEHKILRIFSYGLSFVFFWASAHWATISLQRFYVFTELQNALANATYWIGIIFVLIIGYFAIYLIYTAINAAAQKKREKDDY